MYFFICESHENDIFLQITEKFRLIYKRHYIEYGKTTVYVDGASAVATAVIAARAYVYALMQCYRFEFTGRRAIIWAAYRATSP